MKLHLPWWTKLAAKILLARVPLGYRQWASLGIFRHGSNDNAEYAFRIFQEHFDRARPAPGFVALEMGPGDALSSAVLTRAFGGSASYQVDVGQFASEDVELYRRLAEHCLKNGRPAPDIAGFGNLSDLLKSVDATYLSNGLNSLKSIPSASVDFIYSQSCLEHVRLGELDETAAQLRRVLRKGGVATHWVDLKDHLSYSLNNLRFSENTWESPVMADSGFYTNRVRYSTFLDIFERAGFDVEVQETVCWSELPTPRRSMAFPFRDFPEAELKVSAFAMICR